MSGQIETNDLMPEPAPYRRTPNPQAEGPGTPTLSPIEHHPAADGAYAWLKGYMVQHSAKYLMAKEALASTALSGNRQAEVCMGTLDRMAKGEPVSDRYLLGLAWTLMRMHYANDMELTESMRVDRG